MPGAVGNSDCGEDEAGCDDDAGEGSSGCGGAEPEDDDAEDDAEAECPNGNGWRLTEPPTGLKEGVGRGEGDYEEEDSF